MLTCVKIFRGCITVRYQNCQQLCSIFVLNFFFMSIFVDKMFKIDLITCVFTLHIPDNY